MKIKRSARIGFGMTTSLMSSSLTSASISSLNKSLTSTSTLPTRNDPLKWTLSNVPQRRNLQQYDNSTFMYDLSGFSVRFEKCQLVQMFDDQLASQAVGQNDTPFAVNHFVVFRLCPTGTCTTSSKGGSCGSVYGTYTLDVRTYLESTINYQREELEAMCANCEEDCDEDAGVPCTGCGKICWHYNNLEATGYVDASNYIQCQQVNDPGDGDDAVAIYAGPRCSKSGIQIRIGLFSDANCLVPMDNMNITTVLGATLSYHLLANTYSTTDNYCLSCKENGDNQGNNYHVNDQYDADDVNEMCENLYNGAAKCETDTGLPNGFIQTARNNYIEEEDNVNAGEYYHVNQVENEDAACTFIKSLIWNSYNQKGEINYLAKQDVILREVTSNQKVFLSGVSVAFVMLLGMMYYFQKKIKETIIPGSKGDESLFI